MAENEQAEVVPAYGQLQIRPLVSAERQAALDREEVAYRAELQHRHRIDLIGFSVLVIILLVSFVCGLLPANLVGDQKWAQGIASAVLGLLIGRYTIARKS